MTEHELKVEGPEPRRIGTIASRHEMPVEEYLVETVQPGQSAYDEVYTAMASWLEAHPRVGRRAELPLEVYYSGLTEATLAAADALHNYGCSSAQLMRFDRELQDYEPLQRRREPCILRHANV